MFSLLFLIVQLFVSPQAQFYDAFGSDELSKIDATLLMLETQDQSANIQAYRAGLLMKKASFMKTPFQKLSLFREGRKLLESTIEKNPKVVEYRIIRLVLQENAPEILKYNTHIEEDLTIIKSSYADQSDVVRNFLSDYKKESKVLHSLNLD